MSFLRGAETPENYIKEGAIDKRNGKGTSWKDRWLYLQNDKISYGYNKHLAAPDPAVHAWMGDGSPGKKRAFIDSVHLHEIERVSRDGASSSSSREERGVGGGCFAVHTKEDSHKLGMVYHFRSPDAEEWVDAIMKRVEEVAPKKPTLLWHARRHAKVVFESQPFQIGMAVMIFGNFVANAIEAQLVPTEETGMETLKLFGDIDAAFTWIFAAELCVNLFANLFLPFIRDPWNWFDSVVVISSVVAFFSEGGGITVLRLLRVLRVFRLFRRLKSLAKIMMAIGASLPAVSNALFLMLLFSMIYAILGVQFFKEVSEEHFTNFGIAIYTCWNMMLIPAKAEAITKGLWVAFDDDWTMGALVFVYVVSLQLVQTFIILKIVMAILLKEFTAADAAIRMQEAAEASLAMATTTSPFAGLLENLLLIPTDRRRTLRIDELFLEMDEDESGTLSYRELRFGVVRIEGVSPPVIIGAEAWSELIVARGFTEIDEEEETVSASGWRALVKNELREYVTRRAANAVLATTGADGKLNAALRAVNQLADTVYLIQEQIATIAPPTRLTRTSSYGSSRQSGIQQLHHQQIHDRETSGREIDAPPKDNLRYNGIGKPYGYSQLNGMRAGGQSYKVLSQGEPFGVSPRSANAGPVPFPQFRGGPASPDMGVGAGGPVVEGRNLSAHFVVLSEPEPEGSFTHLSESPTRRNISQSPVRRFLAQPLLAQPLHTLAVLDALSAQPQEEKVDGAFSAPEHPPSGNPKSNVPLVPVVPPPQADAKAPETGQIRRVDDLR